MNNDNNNELINRLRERFTEIFNTLNKFDITERVFLKKVVRTPNDDIIHTINTVAVERILMLEQTPSYIDLNNIYTSAVTIIMYLNCARGRKLKIEKPAEKRRIVNLEEKINSIRQRLSHVYLVIQFQQNGTFTKHQLNIKHQLQKKYGSVNSRNMNYQKATLQQELKTTSKRSKYQKRLSVQRTLNKRFAMNPKSTYRKMKRDNKPAKKIPLKEDVESYWKKLCSKEVIHNA